MSTPCNPKEPDFFIEDAKWENQRKSFFDRADLPAKAEDVPEHLTKRLNQAYDKFLESLPRNSYASVSENGWQLSVDPSNKLDEAGKQRLEELKAWLAKNMRNIRLPELLIEVDNELHVTHHFMPPPTTATTNGRRCLHYSGNRYGAWL